MSGIDAAAVAWTCCTQPASPHLPVPAGFGRAASARIDAAEALARGAGADLRPTLSAGLETNARRQNFIGLPIPGAEDRVLSTRVTSYGLSVNTSWEADLWGRVRSNVSASLADAQAAAFETGAAQLSLAAQAAKVWFALTEAGQQVRLADDTVAAIARPASRSASATSGGSARRRICGSRSRTCTRPRRCWPCGASSSAAWRASSRSCSGAIPPARWRLCFRERTISENPGTSARRDAQVRARV